MNFENIVIAIIGGLFGGGFVALASAVKKHFRDSERKKILKILLSDKHKAWRNLSTLARVIGLDEEKTKHLLLDIGARGSTSESDAWGLISRHPLNSENINS